MAKKGGVGNECKANMKGAFMSKPGSFNSVVKSVAALDPPKKALKGAKIRGMK